MNYPYVGFFKRAAALVVDLFIVTLLPTLLCLIAFSMQYETLLPLPENELKYNVLFGFVLGYLFMWQVLVLLIYWLYFAFCESSRKQATLGKRLLGIKVISQQGRRIRFGRATARAVARLFMPFTCYIGFVMAGCTRRKRALHDMIVQTYVVKKDFKATDALPDTPGHPVWLVIWSVLLVGFALLGLAAESIADLDSAALALPQPSASAQPVTPAQTPAPVEQAKTYLEELAAAQAEVPAGTQPDGVRYFRHADGYRALLPNSVTLFVPNGQTDACCEEDSIGTCQQAGLTACNQ